MFNSSVEKCVGREKRDDQGIHAAAVFAVGFVSCLQDGGVVDCFVATHPEAEGVADEDLLDSFAVSQSVDQLQGVAYLAVECGVTGVDDLT